MDLKDCEREGFIRKANIDNNLIGSLLEMSRVDEDVVRESELTEKNISTFCSVAYSSLRQLLEAICLNKGYKVTNHVCIGLLLKREIKNFDFDFFERVRKIRNRISYYGEKIGLSEGKEIIEKIFKLNKELRKTAF